MNWCERLIVVATEWCQVHLSIRVNFILFSSIFIFSYPHFVDVIELLGRVYFREISHLRFYVGFTTEANIKPTVLQIETFGSGIFIQIS